MTTLTAIGLVFTTFVVLLAIVLYLFTRLRAHSDIDFSILDYQLLLTIDDIGGKHAKLEKTVTLLAKRNDLTTFEHRDLSADGSVENILVDGQPVTPDRDAGDLIIRKTFPKPLRRKQEVTTSISADVKESFLGTREWITVSPTRPIRLLHIRVRLPPGRPAADAFATVQQGDHLRQADEKPTLSSANSVIDWTTMNITDLNVKFRLEWEWPKAKATVSAG
jgi:hypothetical protein